MIAARLTEDGRPRLTEDGRGRRIIEGEPVDAGFAESFTDQLLDMLGIAPSDPNYAGKAEAATVALAQSLALVESYLDRKLEYLAEEIEEFGAPPTRRFLLRRYPVESIASVQVYGSDLPSAGYMVDKAAGVLALWGYAWGPASPVKYAGGYKVDQWPLDLLNVLLQLAASLWPSIYETGGPAPAAGVAAIRRISTPDVGTIEYFEGGGNAPASVLGFGQIPQAYLASLDRYRAASIVGGA